jgi:hypothetical protein
MEDTKGLPMNLIRCALAEAARLEHEQLAAKGEELMEKEELSAPDYEAFKKKAKIYTRKPLKKKILYAAIAALVAISLAMSVSAIREPIINFFVEIYDSFISIFVDAPAPASIAIEEKYELGYLPEGFELVEEKEWNSSNEKMYSDGNKQIKFVQLSYSSELGVEIALDNNESNAKYIDINGNSIVYTQKNNSTTLVWIKDDYVFKLVFNFEITKDEWIRIVEFISKK